MKPVIVIEMEEHKMISRFANLTLWLLVVVAFVFAGCEQGRKDKLARLPEPETITVMSDYTGKAFEAGGGRQAWTMAKKLRLDCVVTFYKSDGSFHLTEQVYEIYPWSNSIRISATEPSGKLVWLLSHGVFSVLEGTGLLDALPIPENRYFAELLLNITTAPVRFLDKPVVFTKDSRPVKMEGLWYHPIERVNPDKTGIFSYAVFYQNRDSSLVDMIWFAGVDSSVIASEAQPSVAIPISLAVRGYDYRELEKGGVRVPAKIEIFRTDAAGVLRERLVKIDCHTLKSTE